MTIRLAIFDCDGTLVDGQHSHFLCMEEAFTLASLPVPTRSQARRVIAISGPPASGKSTLAAGLVEALQQAGLASQLVPMDGFHLDNSILTDRQILDRKGSPPSFDAIGLLRLVQVLGAAQELYYPVFDRTRDLSIAGAGYISPECDTIVIEGNYLLMDAPIWRDMAGYCRRSHASSRSPG